jgi:hypothetical protein
MPKPTLIPIDLSGPIKGSKPSSPRSRRSSGTESEGVSNKSPVFEELERNRTGQLEDELRLVKEQNKRLNMSIDT